MYIHIHTHKHKHVGTLPTSGGLWQYCSYDYTSQKGGCGAISSDCTAYQCQTQCMAPDPCKTVCTDNIWYVTTTNKTNNNKDNKDNNNNNNNNNNNKYFNVSFNFCFKAKNNKPCLNLRHFSFLVFLMVTIVSKT